MHWEQPCTCLENLTPAREHLEQGIALTIPRSITLSLPSMELTLEMHCLVFMAYVLWSLGYPDQL